MVSLVALLASVTLNAATIVNNSGVQLTNFTIDYYHDQSDSLSISAITETEFTREIPNKFSLGYREGSAWFKFTVKNLTDQQDFILYFTEPFWTSFDLYTFTNSQWTQAHNGLRTSLRERSIASPNPAFPIVLPPEETTIFYVKGKTESSHIGEFKVLTQKEYYRPGRLAISDVFNYYSVVLVFTMLLTSFLYLFIREVIYLYYTGYVISFVIWISTQSGGYLYLGIPGWPEALHTTGTAFIAFLAMFSREYLQLKSQNPRLDKFFLLAAIVVILCGVFIAFDIPYTNLIFNIVASVFFIVLLIAAIKAYTHHAFQGTTLYLIALMIYAPSMALMTMTYNGLIENYDFSRYAFIGGAFIEILFFSLILAQRYISISQQKYELETSKQRLTIEASTDPLTGLLNRRYFFVNSDPLFQRYQEERLPLSVLLIDIDRFKGINDNFGHSSGDMAIVACAKTLQSHAKPNDIVTRFGGEEFVILLADATKEKAANLAESIRTTIKNHAIAAEEGRTIHLTVSIGVVQIDSSLDSTIDQAIQRADKALYQAKNSGRNCIVVA
jgi:diguanylate cyclase (GGDEF)-like protein